MVAAQLGNPKILFTVHPRSTWAVSTWADHGDFK